MSRPGPKLQTVAVVGASSQIGRALLPRLAASGYRVCAIGRLAGEGAAPVVHVYDERADRFDPALEAADAIISLAPLPSAPLVLKMARRLGAKRLIAFGSTGTVSKAASTSPVEQDFVAQQLRAEKLLAEQGEKNRIDWTLFRPTMIYGAGMDQNVGFIRAIIRRFGVFPFPAGAKGLRQPVHADDLAAACVAALERERTFGRAYDLGGGEALEVTEMIRRIFRSEGRSPRLLAIPAPLYRGLIGLARWIPAAGFVRKEMAERMYRDLIADNRPAYDDFGYRPRPFLMDGGDIGS